MKLAIGLFQALLFLPRLLGAAPSGHPYEFKGLYVGMSVANVKKLGFVGQKPGMPLYDEKCIPAPGNDRFSSFGGEKVTELGIAIKKGIATMIYIKTAGQYGGGLEKAMTAKYGKPKNKKGSWREGSFMWDRGGAEFVSLVMSNGVNEVTFGYDDSEIKEKAHNKKAIKDF